MSCNNFQLVLDSSDMKLCTVIFLGLFTLGQGHVRLREPPNRSSVWRDDRFTHLNPPINYDDDGLYCGRVHQLPEVVDCGICGDPWEDPTPRANEHNGEFGRGIITGNYAAGQTIPISAEFTTGHQGFFQVQICNQIPETEQCFKNNPLLMINLGSGMHDTNYPIPVESAIWVNTTAILPPGLSCNHCVLRLHYRAGNNWGGESWFQEVGPFYRMPWFTDCPGGGGGMGCGYQETFRSCSDISIA